MSEVSYPSPSHNTRNVTEAEYELLALPAATGVVGDSTGTAVVSAGVGLQVVIAANRRALVRGFAWNSGTTDVPLTITSNASGSLRTDAVVLRLDRSTWEVRAAVITGTPGSGRPALTNDDSDIGVWEVLLAYVTVPNGAVSVTVEDRPQYLGTLVRVADDGKAPPNPALGQQEFRPNTGQLRMWNGSQYVSIYEDTGRLALSPGFGTWTPAASCYGRRVGETVTLRLWYFRQGSTFDRDDTDGSKLGVLPATLRSTHNNAFTGVFSNHATGQVQVRNDGEVWVVNISHDVPAPNTIYVTCTYIRETD